VLYAPYLASFAGLDGKEEAKDAACRELQEESGFIAKKKDLIPLFTANEATRNTTTTYFSWGAEDQTLPVSPEGREVQWATLREAEALLMHKNGMLEAVQIVLHGILEAKSCRKPAACAQAASTGDDVPLPPGQPAVAGGAARASAAAVSGQGTTAVGNTAIE